jgi:BASS family bile acid:Na+ symporter
MADIFLKPLEIDNAQMFQTVFILLGISLVLGILFAKYLPRATEKLKNQFRYCRLFFSLPWFYWLLPIIGNCF